MFVKSAVRRKIEENRTKQYVSPFASQPTCMVHPCLRVTRLSNDERGRRVHFEDEHNPEFQQVYRSVVFTNLKTVKRLACKWNLTAPRDYYKIRNS